jgi:O-methyltransferase
MAAPYFVKLSRIARLDRDARGPAIRQEIQSRTGDVAFGLLGWALNRFHSALFLAYRPDSDFIYGKLSELREDRDHWVRGKRQHHNLGDLARLYSLRLNVAQIAKDGVQGDFAELGVFKGNSAKVLARLAREHGRQLLLFDTFGGFADEDLVGVDAEHHRGTFSETSLEGVQHFVGVEGVTYVRGRFPESITANAESRRYALAHIDCDLYAPGIAALEFFYPRLSPGGLLLIHDYSGGNWEGMTRAVDEFQARIPERVVLLPDKSGTAVLRRNAY